jgi:RNA polymerase sigma factor (sigma-70 family)
VATSRASAASRGAPLVPSEWLESSVLLRIVKRVAYQHGISAAEIDDLLQEVRIALWKSEAQLEIQPAWVFGTASHKAVDLLRRRLERIREVIAASPTPLNEASELMCLVRARVARLPENIRVYYRLRFIEGLTEREISGRTGLCRASVRWLGLQCLKALGAGRSAIR